jgi:membrane protein
MGDTVSKRADGDARKVPRWITNAQQHRQRYQEKLERRPWIAFPLESARRFNKIEGKHLALVIALNLLVAVIPLMIIGYAFVEAFNPHRDVGELLVGNLHLTGSTAQIVKDTFANASSGKSVALSISLISLLITGLDVSATAQIAYARAFTMTPLRGVQKYLRGAAWLILLLAGTGAALTLRSLATHHPLGFALAAGAALLVLEFGFFLVTPRLLLDLPFKWRDLVPGAAVCTAAATVVHIVATFFLRNWFGAYGHAYGGFGVSLALAAFVGIIASFWVWIAAVMGVWWERKAGPAAVAAMEELSADLTAS